MKTKIALDQAQAIAEDLKEILAEQAYRIEIAGSIRRGVDPVGDIELVVIPRTVPQVDLFGNSYNAYNIAGLKKQLERLGWQFWYGGERYQHFRHYRMREQLVELDLFLTSPERWGVIFTLRTGSPLFSKWLVTARQFGGALPAYLKVMDGRLWDSKRVISTPEERDLFRAIDLDWIEPADRLGPLPERLRWRTNSYGI